MKASEAIIAWNGLEDFRHEGHPATIGIGPLLFDGDSDWTRPYLYTAGAAEAKRRHLNGVDQQFAVLKDFHTLVYLYGLDPYLVHRAFLHIDEYQDIMRSEGAGPAEDEHGHTPDGGHGRKNYDVPSVEEHQVERSHHFRLAER